MSKPIFIPESNPQAMQDTRLDQPEAPTASNGTRSKQPQCGPTPEVTQPQDCRSNNPSDGTPNSGLRQPDLIEQACHDMNSLSALTNCPSEMEYMYRDATIISDVLRRRAMNFQVNDSSDAIPQYGQYIQNTNMIQIFVRCIISTEQDPVTRPITNPRTITCYKLAIPNNFQDPWFKDFNFLHILNQRTMATIEQNFPCTLFDEFNVNYKLTPESIFYNYQSAGHTIMFRLNIPYLYHMEPEHRREHLIYMAPEPMKHTTISGITYDASYDVSILIDDLKPRPMRHAPPNNVELTFLEGIHELAKHKSDAIGTVAKLLSLYHAYRNTTKKPITGQPKKTNHNIPPTNATVTKKQAKIENPIPTVTANPYELFPLPPQQDQPQPPQQQQQQVPIQIPNPQPAPIPIPMPALIPIPPQHLQQHQQQNMPPPMPIMHPQQQQIQNQWNRHRAPQPTYMPPHRRQQDIEMHNAQMMHHHQQEVQRQLLHQQQNLQMGQQAHIMTRPAIPPLMSQQRPYQPQFRQQQPNRQQPPYRQHNPRQRPPNQKPFDQKAAQEKPKTILTKPQETRNNDSKPEVPKK